MSRGDKASKHVVEARRAEVAKLALQGNSVEQIAQYLAEDPRKIFRDLAALDVTADQKVESAELRVKHRTVMLARFQAMEDAVAESHELSELEKFQCLLAISDRKIRILNLDDSSLLAGGKAAGDARNESETAVSRSAAWSCSRVRAW